MNIGLKSLIFLGLTAVVLSAIGLYFVYQQEQVRMFSMLEKQGKIIQAQIEVTRAYLAKNYVGKIKQSSAGSGITVAIEHGLNPNAIPFPATATREIGEKLAEKKIFNSRLISDQPMNPANAPRDAFEQQAMQAILNGADSFSRAETMKGMVTYRRASADRASVQACVNCHVGKQIGDVVGMLSVSIPMTHALEGMTSSIKSTGGLLLGLILALLGMVYFLVQKFVLRPLGRLTAISRDIAQGEGDLTKRVPVAGNDEIGRLGIYFNLFIEKIQRAMSQVAHVTDRLASSSAELSSTSKELSRGANEQTSRMVQSASAVEEMTMTAGEVARNSTEAASLAQETSATARSGYEIMGQTVTGMQHVSEAVGQSARIITELGKSSDQIGEIVRVIEDIADQTNLLALNAAIEAARAGEQGRGFAVVADEVRKLAERTTKATKEISDMIRQIQQDTKNAVTSMEEGTNQVTGGVNLANQTGEALEKIQEMVNQTASMIQQIAGAAEEQSTATGQIAGDLEAVAQAGREASNGVNESAKASRDLSVLASELHALVGTFKV